ncbi:MAG TPA: 2-hydroxychromene-2-carboxylate isomerase [Stellaceae bacterium]|jgi:2-hydroxychromene-2-carboxylate isomerase|nr:2-hydroxychromene-2-carboxylate isomerase [Stellaceae bacterium]
MSKDVAYYYTPASPWTYLGHQRFEAIAQRHGATIHYKPVDYGKIFPLSGGLPLGKRAPQRQAYRLAELKRWRDFLGVPLTLQPKYHPVASDLAAQLIIAAEHAGAQPGPLSLALMRACWAEDRNISDAETLAAVATEQGLDGVKLVASARTPEIVMLYEALTRDAIDRQVFGAPFFIYKDEPFWGQDRLDFLDRALAR